MSAICFCGPQSLTPVLHSVPRGWYPPKRPPLHHSKNVQGYWVNMIIISVLLPALDLNHLQTGFHHRLTNHKISTAGPLGWSFTHHDKTTHEPLDGLDTSCRFSKPSWDLAPLFVSQALHQQCPVEQQHLNLHSLGLNKHTRIQESKNQLFSSKFPFLFYTNQERTGYLGSIDLGWLNIWYFCPF